MRSCFSASGLACHSMLSYSATTIASGQAKSTRQRSPHRSTISYCSSGVGNPPSINANRASLSIGDSARPSACCRSSRTLTMPRRPFCSRTTASSSAAVHASQWSAASSVPSARGRRNVRAISTAVHAGAAANLLSTRRRRCADSLVYHEARGRPNTNAGVQNVDPVVALGVEAIKLCGRAHAGDDHPAGHQIQPGESTNRVGRTKRIKAVPSRMIAPAFRCAASALRDITDSSCSRVARPPLEVKTSSMNTMARVSAPLGTEADADLWIMRGCALPTDAKGPDTPMKWGPLRLLADQTTSSMWWARPRWRSAAGCTSTRSPGRRHRQR